MYVIYCIESTLCAIILNLYRNNFLVRDWAISERNLDNGSLFCSAFNTEIFFNHFIFFST